MVQEAVLRFCYTVKPFHLSKVISIRSQIVLFFFFEWELYFIVFKNEFGPYVLPQNRDI